jgi:hypothetical protein
MQLTLSKKSSKMEFSNAQKDIATKLAVAVYNEMPSILKEDDILGILCLCRSLIITGINQMEFTPVSDWEAFATDFWTKIVIDITCDKYKVDISRTTRDKN